MTLAIAVVTPKFAFVGADRRYSGVDSLQDFNAMKVCSLETSDSHGLITYAGAGARAGRVPLELSQWVTNVLRGHSRTLDQSLHAIAHAAGEQNLHKYGHGFGFAGFRDGSMSLQTVTSLPELYSLPVAGKPTKLALPPIDAPFRVINLEIPPSQQVCGIFFGSGAHHVSAKKLLDISRWSRPASTNDEAARRWAYLWAQINVAVAKKETTVGPKSVCAWRHREGGGGHLAFASDGTQEPMSGNMPTVANGIPVSDIADVFFGPMMDQLREDPDKALAMMDEMFSGPNHETAEELLKKIPTEPKTKF